MLETRENTGVSLQLVHFYTLCRAASLQALFFAGLQASEHRFLLDRERRRRKRAQASERRLVLGCEQRRRERMQASELHSVPGHKRRRRERTQASELCSALGRSMYFNHPLYILLISLIFLVYHLYIFFIHYPVLNNLKFFHKLFKTTRA